MFDSFLLPLVADTNISLLTYFFLCLASLFGSLLSASVGIGGGSLVLGMMALFLPPINLIPIHGAIQLGSNLSRTVIFIKHVSTKFTLMFLIGSFIGTIIGGKTFVSLPTPTLQILIALFILYSSWGPKIKTQTPKNILFICIGGVSSFITMFVGATGPLVAPFVAASCETRQEVVSTHATLMSIQHGLKLLVFGFLGFSIGPFIPLLIGMLAFGLAGTYFGKIILNKLPEKMFRKLLKYILTMIALRLLFVALP